MEIGSQTFGPYPGLSPAHAHWVCCRNHISDFQIQKQQENYMAQVLAQKHKKSAGMRQAQSHQRPREK